VAFCAATATTSRADTIKDTHDRIAATFLPLDRAKMSAKAFLAQSQICVSWGL